MKYKKNFLKKKNSEISLQKIDFLLYSDFFFARNLNKKRFLQFFSNVIFPFYINVNIILKIILKLDQKKRNSFMCLLRAEMGTNYVNLLDWFFLMIFGTIFWDFRKYCSFRKSKIFFENQGRKILIDLSGSPSLSTFGFFYFSKENSLDYSICWLCIFKENYKNLFLNFYFCTQAFFLLGFLAMSNLVFFYNFKTWLKSHSKESFYSSSRFFAVFISFYVTISMMIVLIFFCCFYDSSFIFFGLSGGFFFFRFCLGGFLLVLSISF